MDYVSFMESEGWNVVSRNENSFRKGSTMIIVNDNSIVVKHEGYSKLPVRLSVKVYLEKLKKYNKTLDVVCNGHIYKICIPHEFLSLSRVGPFMLTSTGKYVVSDPFSFYYDKRIHPIEKFSDLYYGKI